MSNAENYATEANGKCSHAEGLISIASVNDIAVTQRLEDTGIIVGIRVVDHVIIGHVKLGGLIKNGANDFRRTCIDI